MVAKVEYFPGDRFGRLTLISEVPVLGRKSEGGRRREFIFHCDCGSIVQKPVKDLLSGKHVSCGCHRREALALANTSHNLSRTRQYKCWLHMRDRFDNPRSQYYSAYGGRGIRYDPRWESFAEFWKDMAQGYSSYLELDRIDPDGGYSKSNCRWSTESVQGYNQRIRVTNTSGRTGVYKTRAKNHWSAEIQVDGKTKYLGTFESFEAACVARHNAEIRVYGFSKA